MKDSKVQASSFSGESQKASDKAKQHHQVPAQMDVQFDQSIPPLSHSGRSPFQPSTEKHVNILKDPRLSHSVNAIQRYRVIRQLQQDYGNAHVQQVLDNVRGPKESLGTHQAEKIKTERISPNVIALQGSTRREEEIETLPTMTVHGYLPEEHPRTREREEWREQHQELANPEHGYSTLSAREVTVENRAQLIESLKGWWGVWRYESDLALTDFANRHLRADSDTVTSLILNIVAGILGVAATCVSGPAWVVAVPAVTAFASTLGIAASAIPEEENPIDAFTEKMRELIRNMYEEGAEISVSDIVDRFIESDQEFYQGDLDVFKSLLLNKCFPGPLNNGTNVIGEKIRERTLNELEERWEEALKQTPTARARAALEQFF